MSTQDNKYSNYFSTIFYGPLSENQQSLEDLEPALADLKEKCVYWVMGLEVCPTTGKNHLQCYWQFKIRQRRSALVKIVACFWKPVETDEKKKWTVETAIDYCKKDEHFFEGGVPRGLESAKAAGRAAGGATIACKWKRARQIVETGGDYSEIDDQIYICHNGAIESIGRKFMKKMPDLNEPGENLWLYGKTGCGKSRLARELAPFAYNKMCNKWWDGYCGEGDVIIDDFDKDHAVLGHHMKIWSDRYGFTGEYKGGARCFRPKRIIVTSNWSPEEIWTDEKTLGPIRRRFKVTNMSPLDGAFINGTEDGVIYATPQFIAVNPTQEMDEKGDMGDVQYLGSSYKTNVTFSQLQTQLIPGTQEEDSDTDHEDTPRSRV